MMKRIRQLHLYLGVLFAPLVIFFAFSGALQTFNLHESLKDGSYKAPAWIATLAEVHKDQRTVRAPGVHGSVPLKWFIVLMSVGLIVTSLLGVSMALQHHRERRVLVWGLLVVGIVVPAALLFLK